MRIMGRRKSRSKPRGARKFTPQWPIERFGKSTGCDVPAWKARRILVAHVSGMPLTHIARSFNASTHTVKAVVANRRDLLAEAESIVRDNKGSYAPSPTPTVAPKILCAPTDRQAFAGPISPSFITDIFGYLRSADFSAQHPGIYFLFRGSECVYVGRSDCVAARCGQHLRGSGDSPKEFDRAMYAPVTQQLLAQAEFAAIRALNPKYNRTKFAASNETQDQIQAQAQAA